MSISRRKFLKAGTLAGLFAGIPLGAITVLGQGINKGADGNPFDHSPPETLYDPLAYYRRSAFESYLNSTFRLHAGNLGTVEATLVRVTDLVPSELRASAQRAGKECFSLVFQGASGPSLAQNTYTVEHDALGTFRLFLVPGGPDSNGGQSYVAIINHLDGANVIAVPTRTFSTKRSRSIRTETTVPAKGTAPAGTTTPLRETKPPKKIRGEDEWFDFVLLDP